MVASEPGLLGRPGTMDGRSSGQERRVLRDNDAGTAMDAVTHRALRHPGLRPMEGEV